MAYVVLGASAAGISGVREIRRLLPDKEIILVSEDKQIYSRCILHHYMSGERNDDRMSFAEPDFEKRYAVRWIKGKSCCGVNCKEKKVQLSDGTELNYEKMLIATGASTLIPPIDGLKYAKGVIGFRILEDAVKLREQAKTASHIAVLGAGLVGIDVLSGLTQLGYEPTIIEAGSHILCRQLDKRAASVYEKAFERKGASFYLGTKVARIVLGEDEAIRTLILEDGREVSCDLLIVTAGIHANTGFLKGSGIELDQRGGLIIDSNGQTTDSHVYGAGDVTGKSPIWPAAVKEGIVAASNMAGAARQMNDFFASKCTMNFQGIPSMSLGICDRPDDSYTEVVQEQDGIYRKVIHKNGRIYGAILQGDLDYCGVLTQLIARRIDVSRIKKPLFRIDYSDFFREKESFEFYYEEEYNES